MIKQTIIAVLLTIFLGGAAAGEVTAADVAVADVHLRLAQRHLEAGHPFWAAQSYRRALRSGCDDPNVHRQLSQVLYQLGFTDQAIDEMKLALKRTREQDFLHMELGVYYLAARQLPQARREFERVLQLNPAFSFGYYYLGEVYYRLGNYHRAAVALLLADKLGLPGFDLRRKLRDIGCKVPQQAWREDNRLFFRQIVVKSAASARELMQLLDDGELFEELARQRSTGAGAKRGGYVGRIEADALADDLAAQLAATEVFAPPRLIKTAANYYIVQRIVPYDAVIWGDKGASTGTEKVPAVVKATPPEPVAAVKRRGAAVTTAAAAPPPLPRGYLVISGVYHNRNYAEERIDRLRKLGVAGRLYQCGSGVHRRYEVVVDSRSSYQQAEQVVRRLKRLGLDSYIQYRK